MPFQKGQSGNPRGRPPGKRALTEILSARGRALVTDTDGKRRPGNAVVARALWELVTTGTTTLPGRDNPLRVGEHGWFEIVKFLYGQIDGPPRQEHDITTDGEKLTVTLKWPEQNEN